ncbi:MULTISPECIES: DEDD exonuclease domain-containing protein [Brevibacterium]|uniref:DEDD exonuclease domain-containing protein n=1 Tax=Brevibacterium salitolerans TaxID=1403566 RepID=A0ABN2X8K5_9MICO|nr:DEDD exonuclease domain-containing protein [Brevibacterium sp.]
MPFDRTHTHTRTGQLSLSDLGTPLHTVDFVVVDLETTGASNGADDITEVGAVRVRGGEVQGEFQTLVKPERTAITPFVSRLTGITNAMVADAPPLTSVLPAFLEFASGAVLVAHNAPFDIGFLRRACAHLDYPWPAPQVLDTVTLARRLLPRSEVPNHKLSTLAAHFRARVSPDHRALADARATVDVLHGLFEICGSHGIETLEDLGTVRAAGWAKRRRKTHLADGLPHAPGVYTFLDGSRRVLYIGSSRDLRQRVRSYFTAGETRGRMTEMVTAAQEVSPLVCATELEARVREVRLIGELDPPYNRRSRQPQRRHWIVLTREAFARLSVVRTLTPAHEEAETVLGPFRSQKRATVVKRLLEQVFPLKTCTAHVGSASFAPCAAAQVGRCHGPCAGQTDAQAYTEALAELHGLFTGDAHGFLRAAGERIGALAGEQRYEAAAEVRDAVEALLATAAAEEARTCLRAVPELAAASPRDGGGWDIAVIRHGRLAAAGTSPQAAGVPRTAAALSSSAEYVPVWERTAPHTWEEETDLLLAWLGAGRTRAVTAARAWEQPAAGFAHARAEWPAAARPGAVRTP